MAQTVKDLPLDYEDLRVNLQVPLRAQVWNPVPVRPGAVVAVDVEPGIRPLKLTGLP